MKFKKEDLQNLVWDDHDGTDFKVVVDEQTDSGRWESYHDLVFKYHANGNYYRTHYSQGLTESQDSRPFEYEPDEIECQKVFKEVKMVEVVNYVGTE